jgi:hypothetical protein
MGFKHIGSVSSGTPRCEDLLPAFADLLETICDDNPRPGGTGPGAIYPADEQPEVIYMGCDSASNRKLIADARECEIASEGEYVSDIEKASDIVNELIDALNEFAPEYFYFGAHPGDGADFGFWLYEDWQQMAKDDGVVLLNAGDPNPTYEDVNVAFITDHGNVSYGYVKDGEFVEVWSVV